MEFGEEEEVLAVQVGAVLPEEIELLWRDPDAFELYTVSAGAHGMPRRRALSTCACSHLKAARLSFLSGVRLVKLYVTDTSGKNLSMQHCIVSL